MFSAEEHTGSKPAESYRSHNTSEVRRWSRDNKFPPAPPVPPTPPPPAANLQKRPPAPPAPPVPPAPPAPPAPKRRNNSDRVEPREQPKKKQRFPPPPLPPAPPAPPAPRAPPAPPAPPAPIVNDYDDNDYDGEYYEAWDDGYGPVGWDDGYGEKQATHLEYFTSDEDESMDGADDEVSPTLSYLPPPPPPPPGDSRDFIPPPPPQVPKDFKGWGKGGKFSRRKMASTNSPWFCNVCNKDFWSEDKYKMHVQDDHIPCPEEGCTFSGPEFVMAVHKLKHVKAADGSSVTDSPEELAAWRSMRRANFPSRGNMQRKADLEEKRRLSGALPDPPKVSMLEKLLRRTQIDKGKGFSSKGFGKKGKFKGKGKDGKGFGKEGKGKDWKGKDGKGKGKFSGKKGKGKNKWAMDHHKELPERHHDHATYSVPLPSVVANCVPLEAPFGTPSAQPSTTPDPPKWGLCRFFERGFCFHGENCQYEHVGSPQVVNATAWWALPSSLANRAGRPGSSSKEGEFRASRVPRFTSWSHNKARFSQYMQYLGSRHTG